VLTEIDAKRQERAFVLINVRPDSLEKVSTKLHAIKNIVIADVVYGPYDIIAVIVCEDKKEISEIVLRKIRGINGVVETLTCIKAE